LTYHPLPEEQQSLHGHWGATGKCGGGAQAENSTDWGWKEPLWRDLPSLGARKSFLVERKQEGAAQLGTPRCQGGHRAEQGTSAPEKFCK